MFEGQGFKMLEKATKEEINTQELPQMDRWQMMDFPFWRFQ
jgi:hypothetical protein